MKKNSISQYNGLWDFFYSPKPFRGEGSLAEALPDAPLFTGRMVIPGYWDDHYELFAEEDFFGGGVRTNPDYRKPYFPMARTLTPHASSNFLLGTGFYRKKIFFSFPEGGKVFWQTGPAMWGCSLFCNGVKAGEVPYYSVASSFSIEKYLKNGEENEIILAVSNDVDDGGASARLDGYHAGIPFGTRPDQHRGLAAQGYQAERGGIGDGVSCRFTGKGAILSAYLTFRDGEIFCHCETVDGKGMKLFYLLREKMTGKTIADGSFSLSSDLLSGEKLSLIPGSELHLWSDSDPFLYQVELTLTDENGEVSDSDTFFWGARTLERKGIKLFLNGKDTYFRGGTEHCYFPETANAHFDLEKYLHDLGVLKKAGFNFIRCHTWVPPEPFYEACDILGIMTQTELPAVYTWEEAEAVLKMVRRHASNLIFCDGNEKLLTVPGAFERLQKLSCLVKELAPGTLFDPQEALRGIEYELDTVKNITPEPFPHNSELLAKLDTISDCYGSFANGYFSYEHDDFPGIEKMEELLSVYQRPSLSHEVGILGGYLDFSLEKRYEGTYIGTDLFEAARTYMKKAGIWEKREEYYKANTLFIASLRKQLLENIRSCRNLAGYDYLGPIDTHWHLTGYPCGIFNEFYEEKCGESMEDVLLYNDESILISSRGKARNCLQGKALVTSILLSHYGETLKNGLLSWSLKEENGNCLSSGKIPFEKAERGEVVSLGELSIPLPLRECGYMVILEAEVICGSFRKGNHWKFWAFPPVSGKKEGKNVRVLHKLEEEDVEFAAQGGAILLLDNFPAETFAEKFRTHTSGRALGHSGFMPRQKAAHPIWQKFPVESFGDWQFYPMMTSSQSIIRDDSMPPFAPLLELIPSFKLIRQKSMLSEYRTGEGRILFCGLDLEKKEDPASSYMKELLIAYLEDRSSWVKEVHEWAPEMLKERLLHVPAPRRKEKKIDFGGRIIEEGKEF